MNTLLILSGISDILDELYISPKISIPITLDEKVHDEFLDDCANFYTLYTGDEDSTTIEYGGYTFIVRQGLETSIIFKLVENNIQ